MKRVYVCYPFADNPSERKQENRELLSRLAKRYKKILFISPLLLFDCYDTDDGIRDEILNMCCDIVTLCDEVWVYGSSAGIKIEIAVAKAAGIKVKVRAHK